MKIRAHLTNLAILGAFALSAPVLSAPNPDVSDIQPAILSPYNLTEAQIDLLAADMPVLDVWPGAQDSRIVEVFGAIDIDASLAQIWEIMKNCDKQLQIIENMTKCRVENKDDSAGWDERLQVLNIGFLLPRVKSRFRSEYSPYREIKISRIGGDLAILDGLWNLTTLQGGQTRVTYRARLKPKLPVPRKLMRKATAKDMPKVLRNLRGLAEAASSARVDPRISDSQIAKPQATP